MTSSVLKELEELRSMLDAPKRTFSPLKTLEKISTPRSPVEPVRTYNYALNSAEVRETCSKLLALAAKWVV